jgi:uncharacterized OsmC-like protein
MSNRLEDISFPLGFLSKLGEANLDAAQHTFHVEARQMFHHQKEATVQCGPSGDVWRFTSDEGSHLHGTDLAPFPLGYFNAGMHGDIVQLILKVAKEQSIEISAIDLSIVNHYWLTGSFVLGTGHGHSEPPDIDISIKSSASLEQINQLIENALKSSAVMSFLNRALKNTFAIYVNGRRRNVIDLNDSPANDIQDPFLKNQSAPVPIETYNINDAIYKLPTQVAGQSIPASASPQGKVLRNIHGQSKWRAGESVIEVDTYLELPGASHFAFKVAVQASERQYPQGFTLICAGITFCFMTQLARYIENMKMPITGIRVVQDSSYQIENKDTISSELDTHLYINGTADDATCTTLLSVSERTCYLHATAIKILEPNVKLHIL